MPSEDVLSDLMVKWGEARAAGQTVTAEELCAEHPELLEPLQERIAILEAMSWLDEANEPDPVADTLHLPAVPDLRTGRTGAPPLQEIPQVCMPLESLQRSLVDSGLMTGEEIRALLRRRQSAEPLTSQALAFELMQQEKVTAFQLAKLTEGKGAELVLGNYILLDRLGVGGMGEVFKARHRRMKRVVAIKLLAETLVNSPRAVQRFHREVETLAQLDHPNIVSAYDADEAKGRHFLVMQYVDGENLMSLVGRRGPLSAGQAIACLQQAAQGLLYAHDKGIIHRDIKPSNLIIDRAGTVKILDLGLVRIQANAEADKPHDLTERLTSEHVIMGTVDYMAPEQAVDTHEVDHRADIYSLGCTLYFLLTGQPPYGSSSPVAKVVHHRESPIPSLGELPIEVPECLEAIFRKMLAKKPGDRHTCMQALLEELKPCAELVEQLPCVAPASEEVPAEAVRETSSIAFHHTTSEGVPPASAPVEEGKRARGYRLWLPLALLMVTALAAWAYFGSGVTRVPTPKGILVIKSDDPAIQVVVRKDGAVVIDKTAQREIELQVGDYTIELAEPKGGFQLSTNRFTITRDGQKPVVEVWLEKPTVVKIGSGHRKLAEWVFSHGGYVDIEGARPGRYVQADQLPKDEFRVVGVGFREPSEVTDSDLEKLHDCSPIEKLTLNGPRVTEEAIVRLARSPFLAKLSEVQFLSVPISTNGIEALSKLENLQHLSVRSGAVGPEAMPHVGKMRRLRGLGLHRSTITDDSLKHLAALPNLEVLGLEYTRIGDQGAAEIARIKSLTFLELAASNLTDAGLASLAELQGLTTLAVSHNKLTDEGMPSIAKLRRLQTLDLRNATITDEGMKHLVTIRTLTLLRLDGTKVGDAHLDRLPKLQTLHLDSTPVTDAGLEKLHSQSDLRQLTIRNTKTTETSVSKLREAIPVCNIYWNPPEGSALAREAAAARAWIDRGGFVQIHTGTHHVDVKVHAGITPDILFKVLALRLNGNRKQITNEAAALIRDLPHLQTIDLNSTAVDDAALEHMKGLRHLSWLDLSGTRITNAGLQHLEGLTGMRYLSLGKTGVDEGIRHLHRMKGLRVLALARTGVRDQHLEVLRHLTGLKFLSLKECPMLSDAGLVHLRALELEQLDLHGVNITDAGVDCLQGLTKLLSLDISGTKVTDRGVEKLKSLPGLLDLNLAGTAITPAALKHLKGMPELERLGLTATQLTEADLVPLSELPGLMGLDLQHLALTDEGLKALHGCKKLEHVNVCQTRVTSAGVQALHEALPRCTIVWDRGTIMP